MEDVGFPTRGEGCTCVPTGAELGVDENGTPTAGFTALHAELARGYGTSPEPADPGQVQAMQVVLHLPKLEPPARSDLLAAAAAVAVALCLDERSGPGGPWQQGYLGWKRGRIRKVARRARGAQWRAAQEVPGITLTVRGAQARALVPGPVGAVDPRIKRLQIGGTELLADEPDPPAPGIPVLWVNRELGMTVGKAAAQVGHASMLLAGALPLAAAARWARDEFRCAVREAGPERWRELLALHERGGAVAVRDAGYTEVAPGSITVIAVPPRVG